MLHHALRLPSPIGLDISPGFIAAAQLRRARTPAGAPWVLAAAAVIPRKPDAASAGSVSAAEADRIADTLWRCGFRGRDVVLGVPDSDLLVSALELPPRSSGAPLEELARHELARAHKCDAAAVESAIWDLPGPVRGSAITHTLAVACPHAASVSLLDTLEHPAGARLRVRSLHPRLLALARVGVLALGDPAEPAALLDLGLEHALIAVLHAGMPVYQRLAPDAGLGPLLDTLAHRLAVERPLAAHTLWTIGTGCDPAERVEGMDRMEIARAIIAAHLESLARDVAAVLDYAAHLYPHAPIRRLGLAGPGAAVPGVAAKLAFDLSLRAQDITPAHALLCPSHLADAGRDPRLSVAVGLALASLHNHTPRRRLTRPPPSLAAATPVIHTLNLIPAARHLRRRRHARLRAWAAVALTAALAAGAAALAAGAARARLTAGHPHASRQVDAAIDRVKRLIAQRQADLASARADLLASDLIAAQPDWGRLLVLVGTHLQSDAALSHVRLSPTPPAKGAPPRASLDLDGVGDSHEAVSRLAIDLERSGVFATVRLVQTRRTVHAGADAVAFRMECALTGLPGETP